MGPAQDGLRTEADADCEGKKRDHRSRHAVHDSAPGLTVRCWTEGGSKDPVGGNREQGGCGRREGPPWEKGTDQHTVGP
jgi:hypothetical protein